jgi:hypothetical protein
MCVFVYVCMYVYVCPRFNDIHDPPKFHDLLLGFMIFANEFPSMIELGLKKNHG